MKKLTLILSLCIVHQLLYSQAALVYDAVVHSSIIELSATEKQELVTLKLMNNETKKNTKNTYKVYEEVKRSSNFLDKLQELAEETEKILEGQSKLADTLSSNEALFLRRVTNLSNEASKLANNLSESGSSYQKYVDANSKDVGFDSKLSESEITLSEIGYLLNKAISCRKMSSIQDKEVPLAPKERFDLKTQADDCINEAEKKINLLKSQVSSLGEIQKQLKPSDKKLEKQRNSGYSKEYNIKQPVIGKGVKNK